MDLNFEWDSDKAVRNIQKHGVDFEEAKTVFDDPLFITVFDKGHSDVEERFFTIGMSTRGRLLVVVHTERNNKLRIISARRAMKNEEKYYRAE